ncbi:MAG: hypothetical protein IJ678_02795, partial [Kiritimatiellae bacterium]|nr:hypothetical protein [Kiritimatiellia bacterium]
GLAAAVRAEDADALAGFDEALALLRERDRAEPGSCAPDIAAFAHDRELALAAASDGSPALP